MTRLLCRIAVLLIATAGVCIWAAAEWSHYWEVCTAKARAIRRAIRMRRSRFTNRGRDDG